MGANYEDNKNNSVTKFWSIKEVLAFMTNCSTYHDVSLLFVFMSLNVSLGTLLVLTEVQINDMLETTI